MSSGFVLGSDRKVFKSYASIKIYFGGIMPLKHGEEWEEEEGQEEDDGTW